MALNFSGLDTQATVDALVTEYQRLAVALASLPAMDVSDQGRSLSGAASRKGLMDAMANIRLELAKIAGPAFVTSRMRA